MRLTEEAETMLLKELREALQGRVVVVAVGDETRGDDGVGPLVGSLLNRAGIENVIDGGTSPELDTWKIRDMTPTTVLFVDAVDFGGNPGEVALVSTSEVRSDGFDTHRAPLRTTMHYLEDDLGCSCRLLAIQPKGVELGTPVCTAVRSSAEDLAMMLTNVLRQNAGVAYPGPSSREVGR
jgi:hydrogenase 3 maturation protease